MQKFYANDIQLQTHRGKSFEFFGEGLSTLKVISWLQRLDGTPRGGGGGGQTIESACWSLLAVILIV